MMPMRAAQIIAIVGVGLALLVGGCATPQRLEGSGEIAPQPFGHALACAKDPSLPNCPKAAP